MAEKESLSSLVTKVVSFTVTTIIGAVIFSLLYDALMDRAEGKSSSVFKGFIMKLGAPLATQQSVSVEVEKVGDELIADLRGICTSVGDVKMDSGRLTIKCGENELTINVGSMCNAMSGWTFNNGVLTIKCAASALP